LWNNYVSKNKAIPKSILDKLSGKVKTAAKEYNDALAKSNSANAAVDSALKTQKSAQNEFNAAKSDLTTQQDLSAAQEKA